MGVQVYPGRFAALLLVSLAASTVRAAPADAAASAKCSPFTVKPGTSVSKQTHLSKMWTPDGASHPQDVSSYAPICAQEHSSILNMARSALLLSAGKGKNTALIVGANAVDAATQTLCSTAYGSCLRRARGLCGEPMPTLHRQLTRAVQDMPHAVTVRAAVSDDPTSATLSMFCFGKTLGGRETRWAYEASEAVRAEARRDFLAPLTLQPRPKSNVSPRREHRRRRGWPQKPAARSSLRSAP